jgi:flavodoxin
MKKILPLTLPMVFGTYAATAAQNPNILVAYYSLTGKTESVAKAIADASGGQLYQIQVEKAYPSDTDARRKVLEQEIEENYLPPLKATKINPEKYDIIFLGSPVWGNHISQPVKSFLAKYNLDGKYVIPFVTHSGGGRGDSFRDVAALCKNCMVDMDGWSNWGSGTGRKLTKWVNQQIADIK